MGNPFVRATGEIEDREDERCFIYKNLRTDETRPFCVGKSREGEPVNARCDFVFTDPVCLDEFGNEIVCFGPNEEECYEKYDIPESFREGRPL